MDIFEVFSTRTWQHLTAALLHTLWQAALLALLLSLALRRLPANRHDARYFLALAAQFGVLVAGLATWSILEYEPPRPSTSTTKDRAPLQVEADSARPISSNSIATELSPAPRLENHGPRWISILAIAWLTGVAVMLGRTAGSVWFVWRLARGPRVRDPAILAMVGRIGRELGVGRLIRVVQAADEYGPAVLGVLWPTLLLPASVMTGLPSGSLHAILTHELAHIRRYDYLVNLAQMVVESVLFFNPAVWWLGRQARLEREACCDAAAVRVTGQPLEYSRSLAEWADRSRAVPVGVAAAWVGDLRPGTLLERIRRVLRPGDRPSARVSPSGLLLLLAGGPVLLGLLWGGTTAAVGLAAQALSPAERIERVEAAQYEYAPVIANVDGKGRFQGTIQTADGKPPARPVRLSHQTKTHRGGVMGSLIPSQGGTFSSEVPAGTTWLLVESDDHAPRVVGPYEIRPGQTIDGIKIILHDGFPARVVVTDERGAPVVGARVSAALIMDGSSSFMTGTGWLTNDRGVATIPHAVAQPYHVSVNAPGYQPFDTPRRLTLSAEETPVLKVAHARPSRGVAVDAQGKPVAGAEVRLFLETKDRSTGHYGGMGPLLTTTDAAGRFTLESLRDRATYILLITSKTSGRAMSQPIHAGQDGIRVTLGPTLTIKGTIKPGTDQNGKPSMPAMVQMTQFVRLALEGEPGLSQASADGRQASVDAQGRFTFPDLLPCETQLECAGRTVKVSLDRPETLVTIDLSRPEPVEQTPTRRVVLRLETPDGAGVASGTIDVNASSSGGGRTSFNRELTLDKGQVAFDAPVPGWVMYRLGSMVGYWFKDGNFGLDPGEGDKVVTIAPVPAGAIAGQVLEADGRPVTDVVISCRTVEAVPGLEREAFIKSNIRADAQGRFFISPLPLGGTYAVIVDRGYNRQVSEPVRLDGAKPTERVTLKLARTAEAEVRVVDPDGRPLAGVPVGLELVHPTAKGSWAPSRGTDEAGLFRFDDLSSQLGGYRALVEPTRGYQPNHADLKLGGSPVEIRLVRGHVIEGRMLDAKTGWPIPGVEVYVQRSEWIPDQRNHYEAEARTDAQGRFRFSILPDDGAWQLNDRNGLEWQTPHKSHVFGVDDPEPIEIRATLPSWSDLKPKEPGRE
jgi:beta-lactamase regulating signal transducer with metallopeptidase domain